MRIRVRHRDGRALCYLPLNAEEVRSSVANNPDLIAARFTEKAAADAAAVQAKIAEGLASLNRGEGLDGEGVFRELEAALLEPGGKKSRR